MSWAGEDPATPNGLAGSPLEQASSQQEQTFALEPSGDLTYDASEMDFEEADHPNRGINDVNRMFGQNATFVNDKAVLKDSLAVVVPPISRPWDYTPYTEPKIHVVKAEREVEGNLSYAVEFSDGETDQVTLEELIYLDGGSSALVLFQEHQRNESTSVSSQEWRFRKSQRSESDSGQESPPDDPLNSRLYGSRRKQGGRSGPVRFSLGDSRSHVRQASLSSETSDDKRPKRRLGVGRNLPARSQKAVNYADLAVVDLDSEGSEFDSSNGKRLHLGGPRLSRRGRPRATYSSRSTSPFQTGTRRSGRIVESKKMLEIGEEDIPEIAAPDGPAKFVGAKEHFQKLPGNDDFRLRHCQFCDTCEEYSNSDEKGNMVYCQGCTFSYHQKCLGPRNSRDHLVTKVGDRDFVLQCKRCVNWQKQRESSAPDQAKCFVCSKSSAASTPLRERKTNRQEHKDRDDNHGEDPITYVLPDTINNQENVLFRCFRCNRVCHFEHLPSRSGKSQLTDLSSDLLADERFSQYGKDWTCKDCLDTPAAVESLIAWRPSDVEIYVPGATFEDIDEDHKEYLVKWKKISYFHVNWMSGPWVWGVTAPAMRKAFAKRDGNSFPKLTTEDAIPEESLRVDIVFDVEYTNIVNVRTVKVDQARIKEVKSALVKFKGLGYEDVVWVEPPRPEDKERWEDYRKAYDEWVMGIHVHPPPSSTLNSTLSKLRAKDFGTKVKLEQQPESLSGGKLMKYQLEGINWVYYQWFRKQNAILADEMGLGKTIQIIGFLATLVELHNCYPFLIVVPNSTCPNWRREIQQWAPSLRVVTFYGSSDARRLAQKYELFPDDAKDLRCHIVVTSYEAAQDVEFRRVFKVVHWTGLIVDEGQRLKNDRNLLFTALSALKIPFRVLLTGTPLQNNPRELFNLLQFLDTTLSAKALEEEYAELTKENVPQLHELLRPFFLRRTKAEVLSFLPPLAQIIVPVSLTNVQKKLYRSILANNPELIKSVFGASKVKQTERANLNNILMQLRKCLCHPFVYNRAIEQLNTNPAVAHRSLVDASSKLKLLEIMLPKLKERGHRALIFSQFLNMLDMIQDFLDGLGLPHQRLDGSISSLQKQKRIDEFNAPGSSLFAFLLSTRAGGVGINLATADTVIILDPDFNPHQDIQALSRAHRIGQQKKVLVFQLTTRGTAEEKIMQVGKKKMALDHVLIEQMDQEDDAGLDLESILRYGTDAIFKDEKPEDDIRYDSATVDKLLDRSQMEDTLPGHDNSAESQFSFARVWQNDRGVLQEQGLDSSSELEADPSVWDAILRQREQEAAEEAAAKAEAFGRGRRKRQAVDYALQTDQGSPTRGRKRKQAESDSDTDYQTPGVESDAEIDAEVKENGDEAIDIPDLKGIPKAPSLSRKHPPPQPKSTSFCRAKLQHVPALPKANRPHLEPCIACGKYHPLGSCPLKLAGVEKCMLCGLAHFGFKGICPHFGSSTQLMSMMDTLKQSPEGMEIRESARKQLVELMGDSNARKRIRQYERVKKQQPSRVANGNGFGVAYSHNEENWDELGDKNTYPHSASPF